MSKLIQKSYEIEIVIPRLFFLILGRRFAWGRVSHKITYKQANMGQFLRLQADINGGEDLLSWICGFFSNKTGVKKEKLIKYLFYSGGASKVVDFFIDTYCLGYIDKTKKQKKIDYQPPLINMAFISSNTSNSFYDIMKMTGEQIEELTKAIVWNLNEQTKEGKKRNERTAYREISNQSFDEDKAKQALAKLENKIKSKNGR